MDPCHGDPSPLDPMKSVCLHFPPLSLLYFAAYFLSLSRTNTRSVRYTLATATRLHRIRWSPAVCRHVPPSPQLYTLYISRTDFRWVWMFVAFVHRTQIGCIGQPSRIVLLIVCSQFCLLIHGFFFPDGRIICAQPALTEINDHDIFNPFIRTLVESYSNQPGPRAVFTVSLFMCLSVCLSVCHYLCTCPSVIF